MKHLGGLAFGIAACVIFVAPRATAQYVEVNLTGTYSGGTAYAYAETTTDYATGYYYGVCTYVSAQAEEDNGTWDFYDTSWSCGSTDAEVSWTFTPTGTTDFIEFGGRHLEYLDYYVYQMDRTCGFDGYDCYAYEASVLIAGGPNRTQEEPPPH